MTTLYKQNKDGSFNVWSCVAFGDKVITTYGKENGKMMFEEYTAEPKNKLLQSIKSRLTAKVMLTQKSLHRIPRR